MCTIFVFQKEKLNSGPQRERMTRSTQASPVTSPAVLPNIKEASRCMYRNYFMLSVIWQIANG